MVCTGLMDLARCSRRATPYIWLAHASHMPAVCAQVDPSVSAIVHYVRSLYFKQQRDFAEFYKSSLLYLAFISIDSLSDDQKLVQPCSPVLPDQHSVTAGCCSSTRRQPPVGGLHSH